MSQEPQLDPYGENFRICGYCGDVFVAHHGLQQYCHSKNGIANYCKHKQKALMSEKSLADRVTEMERARLGLKSPLDQNIDILNQLMVDSKEKIVSSEILDAKGYQIAVYSSRMYHKASSYLLKVGNYVLEWINQHGSILTFKITKP
jgi:hypothetical protein